MNIYLDNAASTPLEPDVFVEMEPFLKVHFGNPSSIHEHGRISKSAIEKARKKVGGLINAAAGEIFFTSSGTEADNLAIFSMVKSFNIKNIITTKIEHPAVLNPIRKLEENSIVKVHFLDLNENGEINYAQLEEILLKNPNSLVSLMHANNEIGNLNDLELIGELSKKYNAFFHSDTVQTLGHYSIDVQKIKIDLLSGSAHKFHGPKGIGFLYINSKIKLQPSILGGSQERNMRSGTENVPGIVGLAKALELSLTNMQENKNHIIALKSKMIRELKNLLPEIGFNGMSANIEKSLITVLNAGFPKTDKTELLLYNLDIKGISCSGGSACASGSTNSSHVLSALNQTNNTVPIRFSFSKYNTLNEIDFTINTLKEIVGRD